MPRVNRRKHIHIDGEDFEIEVGEAHTKITASRKYGGTTIYRGRKGVLWVRYPKGEGPDPVLDTKLADFLDELEMRAAS